MAWQKVARADALGDGDVLGVEVEGKPIALYRIGEAIYATDGMCTHAAGLLAAGWMEDGAIECPLHQARLDIRTGKALCEPGTEDLRTYPIRVEGTDGLIDVERAGEACDPVEAAPKGTPAGMPAQSPDREGTGRSAN